MSGDSKRPAQREKSLAELTDAELEAARAATAEARTAVRLRQNAIQAEIETRTMLAGLSGAAREVVRARLFGTIKPTGDTAAEGSSK